MIFFTPKNVPWKEFEQKHAKAAKACAAFRRTRIIRGNKTDEFPSSAQRNPTSSPSRTSRASVQISLILSAALSLTFGLSACSRQNAPTTPNQTIQPRVEETSQGPVSVKFAFDPPVVRLDRDILVTISVTSPTNITVKLPPLDNRVKGFAVAGSFEGRRDIISGKSVREQHVRLTPQIAPEYRIAPMAVTWKQPGTGTEQWFPTKPIVLASEALVKWETGKTIADARGPVWIYPGLKGFIGYTLAVLGCAALIYGLWILGRKARRAVQLRRMSPRERALFELAELIAKGLIARDRVKDFYFELTMIVRSYIERAHSVRAPEQTTEEFLAAVSQDPRFSRDVVKRLREFMQAADLVKYAGFHPEAASVDAAVSTARGYIETDSEEQNTHSSGDKQ